MHVDLFHSHRGDHNTGTSASYLNLFEGGKEGRLVELSEEKNLENA